MLSARRGGGLIMGGDGIQIGAGIGAQPGATSCIT